MSAPTAMIMAGGTGGHVFPALALARALRSKSWQVVWLGTRKGIEARLVPAEQFPVEWLSVSGLRGKGALAWLLAPFRLTRALLEALRAVRRHRPNVVIGLGGFVSGPGGVASWLLRRPLLIHEQNSIAGFTNRCLAHLAQQVFCAFPDCFGEAVTARLIGNPVRSDIAAVPPPALRFANRKGAIRILIIGGSQGALKLNSVVPEALALIAREVTLDVWHQSGERWLAQAEAAYRAAQIRARVAPFIDDMAEAYGWADFVICRSGAMTVAELTTAGVGAVLVPFAAAVDDHQTFNARYLVEEGAALLVAESDLTAESLARELQPLCQGRGRSLALAERARLLARPRATEELVAACLPYARAAA